MQQLPAGTLDLYGIPARKHLRQQQYADLESVVIWHFHRKWCFFQQVAMFQKEGHHQKYLGVSEQYQNQYSRISL